MGEHEQQIWDTLCELDGETVARLFTNYHGTQLLDDGFWEFLQDEGYIEPDEDEPECCENCGECPIGIWMKCAKQGDYPGDDELTE